MCVKKDVHDWGGGETAELRFSVGFEVRAAGLRRGLRVVDVVVAAAAQQLSGAA